MDLLSFYGKPIVHCFSTLCLEVSLGRRESTPSSLLTDGGTVQKYYYVPQPHLQRPVLLRSDKHILKLFIKKYIQCNLVDFFPDG